MVHDYVIFKESKLKWTSSLNKYIIIQCLKI